MRVLFTRIARRELEDAVRYYELEYSGLGRRLRLVTPLCATTGDTAPRCHPFAGALRRETEGVTPRSGITREHALDAGWSLAVGGVTQTGLDVVCGKIREIL